MKKLMKMIAMMMSFCVFFSQVSLAKESSIYTDEYIEQLKYNIMYSDDPELVKESNDLLNTYVLQCVDEKSRAEEEKSVRAGERSTGSGTRYLGSEIVRSYDVLYGEFLRSVAVGATTSYTTTYDFDFRATFLREKLGYNFETGVKISGSVTYQYAGPSDFTPMPGASELNATHRIYTGITSGVVVKKNYGVVDSLGNVVSTYSQYIIEEDQVDVWSMLLCNNGSNLYQVANFRNNKSKNFTTYANYVSILESIDAKQAFDW